MGVRKGVSAARWTPLTPGAKCPELLDAPRTTQRLVQEIRLVDVDQLGPGQHPDDAADGQENRRTGPPSCARLRPRARGSRSPRGIPSGRRSAAPGSPTHPGRSPSRRSASRRPSPSRAGRRARPPGGTGRRPRRRPGARRCRPVRDQDGDHAPDRERVDDLVRQQLVVHVDARQRDQARHEGQLDDRGRRRSRAPARRGEDERCDQLHRRVARRDRLPAVAAAAAQQRATRRSGCCRSPRSASRSPGSASAGAPATRRAGAGGSRRSGSSRPRRPRRRPGRPQRLPAHLPAHAGHSNRR